MKLERYTAPVLKPHEILIAYPGDFQVGDSYVTVAITEGAFRATSAERVDGIDYSAFKILNVFVGSEIQWYGRLNGLPFPATDLFEKWDTPMKAAMRYLDIGIRLRNESDKPQPFAVKFVGTLTRGVR